MIRKTMELSGRTLTLETGRMAKQASGSILLTYGETVLLATATANKDAGEDRGFFPLSVEYREKFYAAGRIPGGFFKREARPSEKEIIGLIKGITTVAKKIGVSDALKGGGYRSLVNVGENGEQEVPHLHFHIFGGEKVGKMVT